MPATMPATMKALLCERYGPPEELVFREEPIPRPGDDGLLLRVAATGLNFPDALVIEDKYQAKPPLPFSPGLEVAGEVVAVGAKVADYAVGDRVVGWSEWGGLAEMAAVRADAVERAPKNLNWIELAGIALSPGTSLHALKQRAKLRAGETLLVLGAGSAVGVAACDFGKMMGARVVAAASDEAKLAAARAAGADATILYPRGPLDDEAQRALTEQIKQAAGSGVDVVYDAVGGDYAGCALRALNWRGRYLVVGFAAGPIPRFPFSVAVLKGCSFVGVNWAEAFFREKTFRADLFRTLFRRFEEGAVRSYVSQIWPLARAREAIRAMTDRRALGKQVVYTPFAEADAARWRATMEAPA